MDTILNVGLSNAVAACALAVIAAAVGYFCRRPAPRHALWLLVLLKLVTPPLIDVPVWRAAPPAPPPAVADLVAVPDDAPEIVVGVQPAPAENEGPEPAIEGAPAAVEEVVVAEEPPAPPAEESRAEPAAAPPVAWRPLLAATWLCGSALWLLVAGLRGWRFARLLRYGQPAPAWLQREADGLAVRLGLSRAPVLRLVPGRVSPMLWAPLWSARLLLPAGLLDRLDDAGRRTLLAHELAHLRRGDHRVRLFELLVTALFWWHPVVWWARRELREAEELCCDAWVLWALPALAKAYALALVETVDFLSEAPAALPALASGVGHVQDLRRRVTMIMQGTTPRALTWGGVLGLLGLGAFLLPVAPGWGQEEEQPPVRVQVKPAEGGAGPKVADDLAALKADLERKRAELMRAEAALKAAQERLAKVAAEGAAKKGEEKGVIVLEIVDGGKRQVIKVDANTKYDEVRKLIEQAHKQAEAAAKAAPKEKRIVIEIVNDGKRQVIELPPGSRVINEGDANKASQFRWTLPGTASPPVQVQPPGMRFEVKPGAGGGYIAVPRAPVSADTEKRLADLEKRLEELMRSVKELHGEMKGARPAPPLPIQPPAVNRQGAAKQPDANNPFQALPTPPVP
ncbi:MAG TPA: M56 family metallopeptidase, partial [Gemmataceae bacterium]|nr:M56 family metallopeptidase [Gemmataceae bacterium]